MMHPETTIRKVLLIDDDEDDFLMFEDAVKNIDPAIEVSYIARANAVPPAESYEVPDILFLDINMPDRNGFEWLRCIRQRGYNFPIVMYSTASNQAYVKRAFDEGADLYFPKPDSIMRLQDSLQQLLTMNWENPQNIKAEFCRDGHYKVFQV